MLVQSDVTQKDIGSLFAGLIIIRLVAIALRRDEQPLAAYFRLLKNFLKHFFGLLHEIQLE